MCRRHQGSRWRLCRRPSGCLPPGVANPGAGASRPGPQVPDWVAYWSWVVSSSCCRETTEPGLGVREDGVSDARVLGVVGVLLPPAALDRQAHHAVTAVPVSLPFELAVSGVADPGRCP